MEENWENDQYGGGFEYRQGTRPFVRTAEARSRQDTGVN